jgi:hypothetical protein
VTGTLVDSNIILDVATEDAEWINWSASRLEAAGERGPLVINPLIFSEVSVRYATIEEVDEAMPAEYYTRAPLPWEAAFLAAKAFERYRRTGGARRSRLPDFFIGAHAAVAALTLLTRDPKRYRTYFPKLRIISP